MLVLSGISGGAGFELSGTSGGAGFELSGISGGAGVERDLRGSSHRRMLSKSQRVDPDRFSHHQN